MNKTLESEIRRAVTEVVEAAPAALSLDELDQRMIGPGRQRSRFLVGTVAVLLIGGLVATGAIVVGRSDLHLLGDRGTLRPSTKDSIGATTSSSSPSTTTEVPRTVVVIPPRAGPLDDRGPIERFIGAPLDATKREVWSHVATEQAIVECMNAAGFEYVPVPFDGDDPNGAIVRNLPAGKRQRYEAAYSGDAGCERRAASRTFVFNKLASAEADIQQMIENDPRIITSRAASVSCVAAVGYNDPHLAPQQVLDDCNASSGLNAELLAVSADVESTWIQAHTTEIETIRDDIAALVAAATASADATGSTMT